MYASVNFTRKSELRAALAKGMPVILYSPVQGAPAFTGVVRCEGPWPEPDVRCRHWYADVRVKDMQVMEVVH